MKKLMGIFLALALMLQIVPTALATASVTSSVSMAFTCEKAAYSLESYPADGSSIQWEAGGSSHEMEYSTVAAAMTDLSKGCVIVEEEFWGTTYYTVYKIDNQKPITITLHGDSGTVNETISKKVVLSAPSSTVLADVDASDDMNIGVADLKIDATTHNLSSSAHTITFAEGIEVQCGVKLTLDNGADNSDSTIHYQFGDDLTVSGSLEFEGNSAAGESTGKVTFQSNSSMTVQSGGTVTIGRVDVVGNTADPLIQVADGGTLVVSAPDRGIIAGSISAQGTAIQNNGGTLNLDSGIISTTATDKPIVISNGGTVNLKKTQTTSAKEPTQIPVVTMTAPSNAPAILAKGNASLAVAVGNITSTSTTQPAIVVESGNVTITTESKYSDNAGVLEPTVTSASGEAVDLQPGVTVTNKANVSATISSTNDENCANYVDNNGNIILAAGATTGSNTLNAAVILADGTIIQGSSTEAPTLRVDENGKVAVTVPAGGSVTTADGKTESLPNGGSVTAGEAEGPLVKPNDPPVAAQVTVTYESAHGERPESVSVEQGSVMTLPVLANDGYWTFQGWSVDGEAITGETYTVTKDTVFTALWRDDTPYVPTPPVTPVQPVNPTPTPDPEPDPDPEPTPGVWSNPYADVAVNDWYYDAVAYVTAKGLMTGTMASTFAPNATMTRAMVWTVLARMEGQSVEGGSPWYALAQSWAVSASVSDGTGPNDSITREQLVTMLYRQAGSPEVGVSELAKLGQFSDGEAVSDWAQSAMAWAVSKGILTGEAGALNPQVRATRGQVAAILMRFCQQ